MTARILVVDDIEANCRLMRAKLELRYYTVITATNGPDALIAARDQQPHIILLDVMMPGMDGYEVCRRLKADPHTEHIPVVMLTALSDREDRLRGLSAGADDFLSKPIEDFALMARLEALTRYNAVAGELRQREARSRPVSRLSDEEAAALERPASILVIDSDPFEARQVAQPLRLAGHTVVTRLDESGQAAKGTVDLIVLALSHQRYNALRLCAHLRSMEMPTDVPIIVTCDVHDRALAAQALGLGASDMITSPVDQQELFARVRTQLRRSRYIDILRARVDRGLELSVTDPLTGLFNRRYMISQLGLGMARTKRGGEPVSVVALDIDHFKSVNDTHGHEAGDQILVEFAERLRAHVRPKDVVCRQGGEEFLVIMPETPGEAACIGAERVRRAIGETPFWLSRAGQETAVTLSAGVATYSGEDGDTLESLLRRADEALYRAKALGRNRIEGRAA